MNILEAQKQFPQISQMINGKKSIYLDSAATSLKPQIVLDRLSQYYLYECANIHRGIHWLSEKNTSDFEAVRKLCHKFIHSSFTEEIIFTKGTTESINLVASTWGEQNINPGDEILVTELEHHSNFVPWYMLCKRKNAKLVVAPIKDDGNIDIQKFTSLINDKTKLCAFGYISNALGIINPAREMTSIAHSKGAKVLIDAAQAAPHHPIDVQYLDCDFLALSGHKIFGPTGVGLLYGKKEILNSMPPYQGGGSMIEKVSVDEITFNTVPHCFEAGTPHIAGVLGLGSAIEFIQKIGIENIAEYENTLLEYGTQKLKEVNGLNIYGDVVNKCAVISFTMENAHPQDIATIANKQNIAIRTGHHCAQPLMKRLGISATARASFSIYNIKEDIDQLVLTLNKINELFG